MLVELIVWFGVVVCVKVLVGEVVDDDGVVVDSGMVLLFGLVVYLYCDLFDEVLVFFDVLVLY